MKLILAALISITCSLAIAHFFFKEGSSLAIEIFQVTCEERGVIELNGKRYKCNLSGQEEEK